MVILLDVVVVVVVGEMVLIILINLITTISGNPMALLVLHVNCYLTIARLDLAFAVNKLCQFMHGPTDHHWVTIKQILWYLQGTKDFGLQITKSESLHLHAYSDSDWTGCPDDRRSTGEYAKYLGPNLISWISRKQQTIA
ncbi:hypothetical protein ACH5RR_041018 [Cinchona calisaya]|uniref:Uncharacterized protein n=1 Tax=Cinchona calisaya TaxID=153742 RepID=A0ABD2XUA6_9GENT